MIRELIRRMRPRQLPVLKAMPAHVANLNLDFGLLMYQMESYRERMSKAVNNSPYISPTKAQ